MPGLHPYSFFEGHPGIFNDHRESGPRFNISYKGRFEQDYIYAEWYANDDLVSNDSQQMASMQMRKTNINFKCNILFSQICYIYLSKKANYTYYVLF